MKLTKNYEKLEKSAVKLTVTVEKVSGADLPPSRIRGVSGVEGGSIRLFLPDA